MVKHMESSKFSKKSANSLIWKYITLFKNLFIELYFLTANDVTTDIINTKLFNQQDLKASRSICASLDLA